MLLSLKEEIEREQNGLDEVTEKVTESKKVSKEEEYSNRQLQQTFSQLDAKQKWIESKYDYTTNVDEMKLDIFSDVISTNNEINKTFEAVRSQVGRTKEEVTEILMKRERMQF